MFFILLFLFSFLLLLCICAHVDVHVCVYQNTPVSMCGDVFMLNLLVEGGQKTTLRNGFCLPPMVSRDQS